MDVKQAKLFLDHIEPELAKSVRGIDLLGQIPISEDHISEIGNAMRHFRRMAPYRWPHSLSVVVIGAARYRYDGSLWPHVETVTGMTGTGSERVELGQWFEQYLITNRLPRFRHLVDEGALRYITPILAHALIPKALVPAYMEHVVWPAVSGSRYGETPDEIQRRLAAHRPAQIPRPIHRFVAHGGAIARDILERSVAVTGGGELLDLLPDWLDQEIREWLDSRPQSRQSSQGSTLEAQPRLRTPAVRYDAEYGRLLLELPHLQAIDGATWMAGSQDGRLNVEAEARPAAWERTGTATQVEIEYPFRTLTVALQRQGQALRTWTFHGPSQTAPVMLFGEDGKLIDDIEYLAGNRWYALRPVDSSITGAHVAEYLGGAAGVWRGFTVELIAADADDALTIEYQGRRHVLRLVQEPATAKLVAPDVPSWLRTTDDAVVAFENNLPVVRLPAPEAQADEDYLDRWILRLSHPETHEQHTMKASQLEPEQLPKGGYEVKLEHLVPGPDVGSWVLEVSGPLGRGLSTSLQLLPQLQSRIDSRVGIASPELPPGLVDIQTRNDITILEEGDTVSRTQDGWILRDENRNGRIPFTLVDDRTGRTATAMILLPIAQWRWTGRGTVEAPNTPITIYLDEADADDPPRLLVSNPGNIRFKLALVDSFGNQIQEQQDRKGGTRGASFSVAEFLTTVQHGPAPSARLVLSLLADSTSVQHQRSVEVGRISRIVVPEHIRSESDRSHAVITWQQPQAFEGTHATITPLSRPWKDAITTGVEFESGNRHVATLDIDELVPGHYTLGLSYDDAWLGRTSLGPPVEFVAGSPSQIEDHIRALPPSGESTVEHALLASTPKGRERVLREAAERSSPAELTAVVGCVARALEQGRATQVLSLPWTCVGDTLARLEIDELPLLHALGRYPSLAGVGQLCVGLAIDRWQPQDKERVPAHLRAQLWQCWTPLGAFFDLTDVDTDAYAAVHAQDNLGEHRIREIDRPTLLDEVGRVNGPEFAQLDTDRVAAMRASLSPLPGRLFDPDGWQDTALSALEATVRQDTSVLESERDEWIAWYQREIRWTEKPLADYFGFDWLGGRVVDYRVHPSAYLTRMSLTTALSRRLLAHQKQSFLRENALDELAFWLQSRLGRIYERDLCIAEFIYARTFVWQ